MLVGKSITSNSGTALTAKERGDCVDRWWCLVLGSSPTCLLNRLVDEEVICPFGYIWSVDLSGSKVLLMLSMWYLWHKEKERVFKERVIGPLSKSSVATRALDAQSLVALTEPFLSNSNGPHGRVINDKDHVVSFTLLMCCRCRVRRQDTSSFSNNSHVADSLHLHRIVMFKQCPQGPQTTATSDCSIGRQGDIQPYQSHVRF